MAYLPLSITSPQRRGAGPRSRQLNAWSDRAGAQQYGSHRWLAGCPQLPMRVIAPNGPAPPVSVVTQSVLATAPAVCVSVRHAGVRASYSLLGWGAVGVMGPSTMVEAWLYSLVRAPPPVDARPCDVDSQALPAESGRDY